jgi:hypothetical protein
MAVLLFNDRGWAVATSAWSAGSKDWSTVTICYQWGKDGTLHDPRIWIASYGFRGGSY